MRDFFILINDYPWTTFFVFIMIISIVSVISLPFKDD